MAILISPLAQVPRFIKCLGSFRAKFNVYRNDVSNYIDLKFLGPFQTGQGGQICTKLVAFFCEQYQNIPRAWLQGFEFETLYDANIWLNFLDMFRTPHTEKMHVVERFKLMRRVSASRCHMKWTMFVVCAMDIRWAVHSS